MNTRANAVAPEGADSMSALMHAHDWEATPLGDPATWPQSLRTLVGVMLGSRQPMFLVWGSQRLMLYNDGYAQLLGPRHPDALGRPFAAVWPENVGTIGPVMDRAYAGKAWGDDDITFVMQPGDYLEGAHFAFSGTPVPDGDGRIVGLFCACMKTPDQVLAERHLKFRLELDERLRHLVEPHEVMAVAAEMLGHHLRASRVNYGYVTDTPTGELFTVERDWTDGNAPSLVGQYRVEDFGEPLIRELKAGRTMRLRDALDDELTAGDGIAATYIAIGARSGITVPLLKGGRVAAALLVHQVEPRDWRDDEEVLAQQVAERTWDAVERALAEKALRQSEGRSRDILESIHDAFYAVDPEWRFTYVNRKTEELWGRRREELMGRVFWDEFPDAVGSEPYRAHINAMRSRHPIQLESLSSLDHRWLDISIFPTADGGLSVYFRDITERKRAEAHRELLLNELNHRVKNTLATVQSISSQTLRNADVTGEARAALESRLFSLSRAHDILTQQNWEGAALGEIVARALEPYRGERESRLHSSGPEVRLLPRAALAIAMALQELATNAVKYGALSNEVGTVDIRWSLDHEAQPPLLSLIWEEAGGPSVQPPQRRGFGVRLIERSLVQDLQGRAQIDFAPSGVVCKVDIPLLPQADGFPSYTKVLERLALSA
ncbi:PAS domain-containing sensor histidine kinase [Microvirga alba]|uniref:Blue-light-activated histidine kinase n=1 Tax=Microvirga alba TaxID=2791025 RepID=A0A931BTR1_9HYPH|nr:HWE histidine kinase domain-containing protein [Microvirga alba]MBF9233650.1 PAS domain-containing protein [Microvirga alba]